jgi:hypothetical protein
MSSGRWPIRLITAGWIAAATLALVATGLSLWAWPSQSLNPVQVAGMLFLYAALWTFLVGTLMWMREYRKVGGLRRSYWAFVLARPTDSALLPLWRWGRITLGAWALILASMLVLALSG